MALALLPEPELLLHPWCRRRTVLVAVGTVDRRAAEAIRYAALVPADDRRAVHVGVDDAVVDRWCHAFPDGLALDLLGGDDVPAAVADHARLALETGSDEVLVVLGHLVGHGLRHRLLHDRTAPAIAAAIDAVPGAQAVLVHVHPNRKEAPWPTSPTWR